MAGDMTNQPGFTVKDLLVRLETKVDQVDTKVDDSVKRQVRIETIITEGKYAERLSSLEAFKSRAEGMALLAKAAIGTSVVATILSLVQFYLQLTGQK